MLKVASSLLLDILLVAIAGQYCDGLCGIHPPSTNNKLVQSNHHRLCKSYPRYRALQLITNLSNDDNDDNDADKDDKLEDKKEEEQRVGLTYDELMQDPEYRQKEFDESQKRRRSLFLGQDISRAITSLGWLFVIVGIILNNLGYAWVQSPGGGLGIGTLDDRDFQREIIREKKRDAEEEEKNNAAVQSISMSENTNMHIFGWLDEKEQDLYV